MDYYSITDSAKLINKSESTVKRMVQNVKAKTPKDYKNSKYFKFERLPTGHDKTLINKEYLYKYFDITPENLNGSTNDSTNDSANGSTDLMSNVVNILQNQLEAKDRQIEQLNERLREANVLALENTRKTEPLLLAPKSKKWWKF